MEQNGFSLLLSYGEPARDHNAAANPKHFYDGSTVTEKRMPA